MKSATLAIVALYSLAFAQAQGKMLLTGWRGIAAPLISFLREWRGRLLEAANNSVRICGQALACPLCWSSLGNGHFLPVSGRVNRMGVKTPLSMEKHQRGLQHFHDGQLEDALQLLGEAIAEGETSERWNDWAAVQLTARNVADAEKAFERALKLEPDNHQAAANLGALLAALGRAEEAVTLLERCQPGIDGEDKAIVAQLLMDCRSKLKARAQSS
jgi:tetratricopeptide (TPR) repeat protein